jgi:stress response protein SCP2
MIRTVSAQLFTVSPTSSQKLSELSVCLGSIVLDSAVLTQARFDFSKSNEECAMMLDEVKLMANSKLNKQYPLVDFSKLSNV